MAILDTITVGAITDIVSVSANPTTSGVAAPIGSVALLNNSGVGQAFLKISSSNTGWDQVITASLALTNPMTTLGDTIYGGASGVETRLAGNTSTTREFLTQTGTGSASAAPSWNTLLSSDIPALNYVTSVGLSAPAIFTVSNSPVTSSGTIALGLATQAPNAVWAGPASGVTAVAPTFRALVAADIPSLPYLSTALASADIFVGNGSGVATAVAVSGDLTLANTGAFTIANNAVTNAKAAQMATLTLKGNNTGSTANAIDLTVAQVNTMLGTFTSPMTTLGDTIYGGASGAATRLAGNTTAVREFLSQTGTGSVSAAPSWGALVSGDIPNNAANTSGTAANITATSNATLTTLSALTTASSLASIGTVTTGVWNGSVIAIAYGGTNAATASAAFNNLSPMTTLGDVIYGAASGAGTRLAGNTSATKQFLTQTGTGTVSAAPAWGALASGDIPNNAANTSGTAANITATSNATLTTLSALTTASALASVGTITTGTWHGSIIPIAYGGTNSSTTLNNNRIMVSSGGAIVEAAALTNGQLLIGSTAAAPVAAALAQGATAGVTIVNGAGSITLDTAQDIRTTASPTFAGATISGMVNTLVTVATTTATATTLATVTTASDQLVVCEAHIIGRRTGGTAGNTDDSGVFNRTFAIKNVGGTVSVALVQSDFTYADQTAWAVSALVSGTSVLIQVAGAANNNISWSGTLMTQSI